MKYSHQRGAALIISMSMLSVLSLVGLSAIQLTQMNTKISKGVQDQQVAFQSAETALRIAEERFFNENIDDEQKLTVGNFVGFATEGDDAKALHMDDDAITISGVTTTYQKLTKSQQQTLYENLSDVNGIRVNSGGNDTSAYAHYMIVQQDRSPLTFLITATGRGNILGPNGQPTSRVVLQSTIGQ